jgi:hypothetical protein
MTDASHRNGNVSSKHSPRAALLNLLAVGAFALVVFGFFWTRDHDEQSVAWATWALALFTLVLAIGIPLTIRAATREQEESSRQFLKQEQDRFYAQLDNTYLQIQKLIIEHPHLGNPDELFRNERTTPQQLVQYDAFAFVVWNFIESIHDFTKVGDDDSAESQDSTGMLSDTWSCILEYEGARHATWFTRPENQRKFKKSFRDHIGSKLDGWLTAQAAAADATG